MTQNLRIAFLGIGLMGMPMASRLLNAGLRVTVWNRTREKADALAKLGAVVATTAAEAVTDADVVITMLASGPIVEEVVFQNGVAQAMPKHALLIDMSSIPPQTARDHQQRLTQYEIEYLDSPVSGGVVGAREGTLAIMVGGTIDNFERVQIVLKHLGRSTHVGPAGSGQLVKLANQIIVGLTIGAVAEGLLLASAGGAEPAAVRNALRGGFAESRILEVHGQRMVERNFIPGAPTKMQLKDLNTALQECEKMGLQLPLTQRARDLFQAIIDFDKGELYDHSAFLLELERLNSPKRVGIAPDKLPE